MWGVTSSVADFRRLRAVDPVAISSKSCLIERRAGASCTLCRDACPTGVLTGSQWRLAIESDGCVGCGLCAAACPTGGLVVDGCKPQPARDERRQLTIECRRTRSADREPDAIAVPCLGGLTSPDLLEIVAQSDVRIVLVDRGWCSSCSLCASSDPWETTVDEIRSMLVTVHSRLFDRVVVERRDLSQDRAEPVLPVHRAGTAMGRWVARYPMVDLDNCDKSPATSRSVVDGRGLVEPVKRTRILKALGQIAARFNRSIPTQLMPAIMIADGCDLSGVCTAICPTGALSRNDTDASAIIDFDAGTCISCGECERGCPSKALNIWPNGVGAVPGKPERVLERRKVACVTCGDRFVAAADELVCPSCRKNSIHDGLDSLIETGGTGARRRPEDPWQKPLML